MQCSMCSRKSYAVQITDVHEINTFLQELVKTRKTAFHQKMQNFAEMLWTEFHREQCQN